MEPVVTIEPTAARTRLLMTRGADELLRAELPALDDVKNRESVTALLRALSLWMDARLCVALRAVHPEAYFNFELTDELGIGARSVFYAVEIVERRRRIRGRRLRGVGDFSALHQLALLAQPGRAP